MATENTNNNPTYTWLNFGYDIAGAQLNAATSYAYNRNLMSYQNDLNKDFNQWNYTNAASLQRAGLEKAGYNPILALGGSPTYSGGSVGGSSVNVSDSQLGSNNARVTSERRSLGIQDKAQKSQAYLNNSQENVNNSQQLLNNTKLNTEYETQKNIEMNTAKTAQDIKNSIVLTQAQIGEMGANASFQKRRSGGYSSSNSWSDNHTESGKGASFGFTHSRGRSGSSSSSW